MVEEYFEILDTSVIFLSLKCYVAQAHLFGNFNNITSTNSA